MNRSSLCEHELSTEAGQFQSQFGWSVIAAYSNRGGDKRQWSYGVMGHIAGAYGVGITTTSDDEFGVVLNLNLAERFFAQKEKYLEYLKALQKPQFTVLIN
jgi:hypothetical protein